MKKSKIISISINLFLILIIFLIYILFKDEKIIINLKEITIIGFTINIFIILSFYIKNKYCKSAYFLFQFLSIPFLYGQLFTRYVMNYNSSEMFDMKVLVTENGMINAIFLIIFCQLFINLGYEIYKTNSISKENTNEYKLEKKDEKTFIILGFLLIIISFYPALREFYKNISISMIYGYKGRIAVASYGINSILSKLTPLFYIGIICLMLGYRNKQRISGILLLFSVIFYGLQMLYGNRGTPLLMVVCLLWFYHFFIRKFKFKNIIIITIISVFLISFLNIIRNNRKIGINEWINNIGYLLKEDLIYKNPLIDLNYEVGTTIYPITYTLEHIPDDIEYKYGMNYVYSIYSIVKINMTSSRNKDFVSKMNIAEEIVDYSGATFGRIIYTRSIC